MKTILITFLITMAVNAFGHGGNKPGPHGGHIRMPGAFHTELVLGPSEAKVYLLDVKFKNPTTKKSKVSMYAVSGSRKVAAPCRPEGNYFMCKLPADYSEIIVEANRNGLSGKEARYQMPLAFTKPETSVENNEHSHHNH